jgi:CRISPR-associated protein Cpf1
MEQALSNLLYNDDIQWFKWYDIVRNYFTKKPQDDAKENKLKLNFGTPSLLGGWSDGQEKNKAATILKCDNDLYLCILKTKNIFDTSKDDNPIYTKQSKASRLILRNLAFKTLAGKGFLSENGVSYGEMGKDNPTKAIQCLQKIIKERYVNKYPLLEKFVTNTYTDKSKFDAEINESLQECYVCEFVPIDWNIVTERQNNAELFLFEIHCKDYQRGISGKKDLQTMYWEDVLSDGSKHQLCAGAEIFMREPVANESPIKHKVGSKMVNKRYKEEDIIKTIPEKIYREIYMYANGKTKDISPEARKYIDEQKAIIKDVKHEIVKDNRFYGEPKYMFHCPIKLYFESKSPKYAFPEVNAKITDSLQQSDNLQFIGIDRGEKHLVYSCTIDKNAKIIKCNHHDNINGTDYVKKLEDVADERIIAKKNWQAQNKIKDLKTGYISHVVHRLVEETIKDGEKIAPHAYIVLEDLNTEMKRGRQKIEKQIYQNLETALAKKLNFVVDKDAKEGELGSVSKALQLTPPISNYQDIEGKKQFGVMLYTRANYTSVTDPATGWRKTIYIKNGKEEDIKNQIFKDFSDFGFDGKDYYFEYTEANAKHTWRLYSGKDGEPLPRFQNKKQIQQDKNIWVPEKKNVVKILDELFADFDKAKSFKTQIEEGVELKKAGGRTETAWQSLRYALELIQQIRNSGEKDSKDDNFLYSPVRNENGEHFDTRHPENNGDLFEIKDADANGAYNIARKGLIMDAHIKHWIESGRPTKKGEKSQYLDLLISDKEWDLWLLNRKQWEKELPKFALRSAKGDND